MKMIFYDADAFHLSDVKRAWYMRTGEKGMLISGSIGHFAAMNKCNEIIKADPDAVIITNYAPLLGRLREIPEKRFSSNRPYYELYFYRNGQFIWVYDIYPNISAANSLYKLYAASCFGDGDDWSV